MNFLSYDSPFMASLRNIVNYVFLGILWIVASIPLITFGAATTAMFYTAEKSIQRDNEKVFSTFWKCFRKEFKQATVLWLIGLLLTTMLCFNVFLLWRVELHSVIFVLLLLTVLVGFAWIQLWFGYLSKFQDSIWVLLRNTFQMTVINFPRVLLLAVLAAVAIIGFVVAFIFMTPIVVLIPGVYGMLAGSMLRSIFKVYLPDESVEVVPSST